jgi:hypothetical protein
MNDFSELCALLDEELERQENILFLMEAQNEALRVRDLATIDARTVALASLCADAGVAEAQRGEVSARIALQFSVPASGTLRQLAEAAPEPWRDRLMWYRTRLSDVLRKVSDAARQNALLIRTSIKNLDRIFQEMIGADRACAGYTENGRGAPELCAATGFLDRKG